MAVGLLFASSEIPVMWTCRVLYVRVEVISFLDRMGRIGRSLDDDKCQEIVACMLGKRYRVG